MRWTCFLLLPAIVMLFGKVSEAATLPSCVVSQTDSEEISAAIPNPGSAGTVTWTVDEVLTENHGAKTTFRIEPWDVNSYTLSAFDTMGAKICEATVSARALPADAKTYMDPFPVRTLGAKAGNLEIGAISSSIDHLAPDPARPAISAALDAPGSAYVSVVDPAIGTRGGQIAGEVKGSAEEPIAGANVQITNSETGVSRKTKTSPAGSYELLGLDPGKYSVTVTKPDSSVWKEVVVVMSRLRNNPRTTPVKVYYTTERELQTMPPALDYGHNRSDDNSLRYGVAVVMVPDKHPHTILSEPEYWNYDADEYAASFSPLMQQGEFLHDISLQVAQHPDKKCVMVFVHGFNSSFREDIYKTAQLAYDTQFSGVPLMFDWPATTPRIDLIGGYITDLSQIVGSETHLEDFIESLAPTWAERLSTSLPTQWEIASCLRH